MTTLKWPWFPDDGRERGWFIDGNSTRFGPLPEKLRFVSPTAKQHPQTPRAEQQPRLIDPWRESRRP